MEKLVYIIVLNYNNFEDTVECIDSLEEIKYDNYKIVIIDNKSTDSSNQILREKYSKKYVYIENDKNLGYAGGNNKGVKYALVNNAQYICILNNDTVVKENFLKKLVNCMELNLNCGIVGPVILEYYNPKIVQSSGAVIKLIKGDMSPINSHKNIEELNEEIIKCDYIGGACILIRREVIEKIGLIPEDYFLFYEETDWCYKAKQYGYDIVCFTPAQIFHKGSSTIDVINELGEYLMNRNKIVFIKKNASLPQLIFFFIYLIAKTLYDILIKNKNSKIIKYYFHGVFNIIDKRYPFIYINGE
ncbi:N-acetylglucosaminyl-diphospho-decaprenol L-rhamnosyltransferase [Clostridium puniceum]|uniref:N-acetylglucosaminyl-diphospho-decaprenol L-rhamnosyltransferase n=1 Tax=Clostridium puniceum TaxID=29367 RepID=A0A1S8TDX2_9CLOT|nr:glycosyltransferase family 2 protein [Clostridium puniceum]OOM75831.1 N-acetylglucosaminyl-diphospho-decaprenol L-rhamnosyltransferase [Clostridium puniceum]